jgi:lactoylglutathione lyase
MSISGLRFGHVAFKVSDVERSLRWYADAFGAKKIYHAEAKGERPELMFLEFATGQYIELFTGGQRKIEPPSDRAGYMHFCLLVDDINEALSHLTAMKVHIERPLFTGRAKQRIFFISDPDGNVIEMMEIPRESPIYRD